MYTYIYIKGMCTLYSVLLYFDMEETLLTIFTINTGFLLYQQVDTII